MTLNTCQPHVPFSVVMQILDGLFFLGLNNRGGNSGIVPGKKEKQNKNKVEVKCRPTNFCSLLFTVGCRGWSLKHVEKKSQVMYSDLSEIIEKQDHVESDERDMIHELQSKEGTRR